MVDYFPSSFTREHLYRGVAPVDGLPGVTRHLDEDVVEMVTYDL